MFEFLKSDIGRLKEGENTSFRTLVAGIVSPGFQALAAYRFFNWCHRNGIPSQPLRYFVERLVEITTGISIPACCKIGKGFRIHHFGGVIFHSTVEIGDHCTAYHQVTIGDRGGSGGAAKLGNHVLIGAGAKIIGEIAIGDRCKIGANCVVTKNMPPDTVAFGNPAQYRIRSEVGQDEEEC
jgi:serine O-acetyltransferase